MRVVIVKIREEMMSKAVLFVLERLILFIRDLIVPENIPIPKIKDGIGPIMRNIIWQTNSSLISIFSVLPGKARKNHDVISQGPSRRNVYQKFSYVMNFMIKMQGTTVKTETLQK